MPNTNKIQLILDGAFMPDYYSPLASHFLNIWVEFEIFGDNNNTDNLESKYKDLHHWVCFIIIINNYE